MRTWTGGFTFIDPATTIWDKMCRTGPKDFFAVNANIGRPNWRFPWQ
jgi:hypothetical protein